MRDEVCAEDGESKTDCVCQLLRRDWLMGLLTGWRYPVDFRTSCPGKHEETDADDRGSEQARQQMILQLAKGTVHHPWETPILEIDAVYSETKQSSWRDNEEDKTSALGREVVHDRVDQRQ